MTNQQRKMIEGYAHALGYPTRQAAVAAYRNTDPSEPQRVTVAEAGSILCWMGDLLDTRMVDDYWDATSYLHKLVRDAGGDDYDDAETG